MAPKEKADLGLVDSQNLSGPRLGQVPVLDDARDLPDKFGLEQEDLGIRKADVGEDVPSAFSRMRCVAHGLPRVGGRSAWIPIGGKMSIWV